MDPNEDQYDQPLPKPGVSTAAFFGSVLPLLAVVVVLVFLLDHVSQRKPPENLACTISNATARAQAEANKAQIDYQAADMKREHQLRMEIIETCVKRGNIPVIAGNQIDCRPAPPKAR